MINDSLYGKYLAALLAGQRADCHATVTQLLDGGVEVKDLYSNLFQRSMYEVGELWENNRITVANEHLATAITESLLNLVYPSIFTTERTGRKAVVSCSANEFHQVGGKMVADIMELNGWDGHFLGANSQADDLLRSIDELQPDVVGFSLSILSNIASLVRGIEAVRSDFPNTTVLVGGQAFRWGGLDTIKRYSGIEYVSSLDELEQLIRSD